MSATVQMYDMLERERVANRRKHWVRAATACNSRCLFCLDSDTPRNLLLPVEEIRKEIDRGRTELDADKLILSGGEASLHPAFAELIAYAKAAGYELVQTVTNGYRFADRDFYETAVRAGLGEITFSLHGHTPELHDRLTQTEGAFERLMKGMIRAVRDPRVIANVDVVINQQNVAVIDKIVELCIGVGVTEFDLLHVIPQAAAFDHRDELFYDPKEYLPVLHKVFRLNRHPRFHIWTNRFPIAYLEGLEDLIQDPHKMFDEVNGRRFQLRRYLDEGTPLDCRQPDRCVHCFLEPFCTTADRVVAAQNRQAWDVWWIGEGADENTILPFGCTHVGIACESMQDVAAVALPPGAGLYATVRVPGEVPATARNLILVADSAAHLQAWLREPVAENVHVIIHLTGETAAWILENLDSMPKFSSRVTIHQPSHEHLAGAVERDVRGPRSFFARLPAALRVSGLPACLAPGMTLVPELRVLQKRWFDPATGRLDTRELTRHHVAEKYRAKSVRCRDCVLEPRCEGLHINMIRDQGLALAEPVTGAWAAEAERQLRTLHPEPPARLAGGRRPEPVAPSLPGFPPPQEAAPDPLGVFAEQVRDARRRRAAALEPR